MSDQTERSQSDTDATEEQKPSPEAYDNAGLGGESQGGDAEAEDVGERSGETSGALSQPSETPEESTGDVQEGTTSENVESGDEEVPQPPDEGIPS